ncbi:MAG: hypothetical protein U5K75_09010 [Ahrensia sp.]|nr:hypothetical protein [Ahrensia sp.]
MKNMETTETLSLKQLMDIKNHDPLFLGKSSKPCGRTQPEMQTSDYMLEPLAAAMALSVVVGGACHRVGDGFGRAFPSGDAWADCR